MSDAGSENEFKEEIRELDGFKQSWDDLNWDDLDFGELD
jgi:hypothetical protein